jgi:hypothetical protein
MSIEHLTTRKLEGLYGLTCSLLTGFERRNFNSSRCRGTKRTAARNYLNKVGNGPRFTRDFEAVRSLHTIIRDVLSGPREFPRPLDAEEEAAEERVQTLMISSNKFRLKIQFGRADAVKLCVVEGDKKEDEIVRVLWASDATHLTEVKDKEQD